MNWAVVQTPIGPVSVGVGEQGVRAVHLVPSDPRGSGGASRALDDAVEQLLAYFAGSRTAFDLPLSIPEDRGSEFERAVWAELLRIPYGEMRTYGDVAAAVSPRPAHHPGLGDAGAARAVGTACNHNPIPVIVPCHRVVGAGGKLVGFGAGLPRKRWLLEHEARVTMERDWS